MPARKDAASQKPGASRRRSTSTSGGSNGRHVAEEALTLSHRFLEIANRHSAKAPLLKELVVEVQRYTGCAAVAIRMLDEEGNIPYEAYVGFSDRFYELESPLSIESDECMCINVVRGQTDPKLPFYTEGGSFFMNATTRFLATVSEEDKGRTRNACNEFGYESVALVPMRLGDRILGVIHVADTREDMVPLAMVEALEGAAAQLGTAIRRVLVEDALRESEEMYRDVVEGVDDLVTQVDGEGRFIFVNHAARKVFGLEPRQCVGLSAFDFVHPDDRARTKEAFAGWIRHGRRNVTFENRQIGPGGEVRDMLWMIALHFDDAGEVTAINSIAHDITERKRAAAERRKLEERVQHAQKLESMGLLAGGIAHDFNNMLVSVLGNADLALVDMSEVAPGRGCVEDIKKAAIRASELTGQMLAYSGRGRFLIGPVDLSELVRETGRLLEVSIPKSASLRYELADGLPAVEADAAQIHQVVMNLITNASEAIGEEGGSITVRTGIIDVGPEYLAATDLGEGLPEGPYLFLEVSDTGRGMDRQTRARLFDPFFSTKFAGRGLGLAAVLGIVRGHKGIIRVYGEPGEGTTFKVLLPFSDRPAPAPQDEWRGRGTVLIIDDEPTVRHVARAMLERTGLTVLDAPDGRTGVELFRQHRDEIDAVLLDLTMPRMSGEETLRQLRRIREDVPVILSSGYDESHATSRFTSDRLAGFLQKPFELKALVGQFRRVMEARPAGREEA